MIKIKVTDSSGVSLEVGIDGPIDYCPICHHSCEPINKGAYLSGRGRYAEYLDVVYVCPREACRRVFKAVYGGHKSPGPGSVYDTYYLLRGEPVNPVDPNVDRAVRDLSPSFYETFKQADRAAEMGLDQVCGGGYRRALEFLIKDYLISTRGLEEETINQKFLGRCIEDHVASPQLKSAAKRTAWLGNDETHYYRKWETKDVDDLRRLLTITINFVANELALGEYEDEMPDPESE
jgi:hypothetical protein